MMSEHYILDKNGKPVRAPDLLTWGRWFENAERHVAETYIGELYISTVFLGLDHNLNPDGSPILWETMVFNENDSRDMDRCSGSREQAEAMHERMVKKYENRENR